MNYLIMGGSILFGVFAFATMASISGKFTRIDFRTASLDQRQAWLDRKAGSIRSAMRWALPSGRGPRSLNFKLREIVTRPRRSELELIIDVKVPYGARVGVIPRSKFLERFCKNCMRLGFYEQGVGLIANFKNQRKNTQISRISIWPHDCRSAV